MLARASSTTTGMMRSIGESNAIAPADDCLDEPPTDPSVLSRPGRQDNDRNGSSSGATHGEGPPDNPVGSPDGPSCLPPVSRPDQPITDATTLASSAPDSVRL